VHYILCTKSTQIQKAIKFKWWCSREKNIEVINVLHIHDLSSFEGCDYFLKAPWELKKQNRTTLTILKRIQIKESMKFEWWHLRENNVQYKV